MAHREQLNLRLPPDWFEVLIFAAAFDKITVAEYVKLLIADKVQQLKEDPDIQVVQILSSRRASEDKPETDASNVTQLKRTVRKEASEGA
jgi:hypothetical protein